VVGYIEGVVEEGWGNLAVLLKAIAGPKVNGDGS
jgi:hypothetical protein